MHFLIEDEELLKTCNDIWNKVSNNLKKEFDSEPIHNKKFLKTKIKSDGDEATDFHDKEIPKVGYNYACEAVILSDLFLQKKNAIICKCWTKYLFWWFRWISSWINSNGSF